MAYTRLFEVPADWKGGCVKLRCHEIAAAAEIWMNGRQVGSHVGHFIPFTLDVTDQLKCGETNRIVIVAYKYSLGRDMSAYAVHVGGGITRKIELIRLPSAHVMQLHVATDFDDHYEDATLHVTAEIANESGRTLENAGLEFSLVDAGGHPAKVNPQSASIPLLEPGKRTRRRIAIHVKRPSSRNAEQPRLYRLTATLRADGQELQQIERQIGFREIEVRGNELLVNGHAVKLRGANAPVEVGHRAASVAHLINVCRQVGRRLQWDCQTEQFIGDDEANRLLLKPRRRAFALPVA